MTEKELADGRFLESVAKGEVDKVQDMLRGGQSLQATNESGETCIHMAVSNADEVMLNLLIGQAEAPVDKADKKGARPVTIAIQQNNAKAFETLYAKGADITKVNEKDKTTLLHTAVWAGHEEMVAVLLRTGRFKGALLEAEDYDGRTALHQAAFRASGEVCKMLIDAGAEGVGIPDKFAMKPANLAERSGRKKSKEYLLQCEAAFDATLAAVKLRGKIKSKEATATGVER